MADLFTHMVAARAPGVLIRDRRWVALLVIGTFLPDLASKGLYWILQAGDAYAVTTHSLLGVLAISYLACLFVEESLRPTGFVLLLLGGLIHLAVDMAKNNLGSGAVFPFLPFSDASFEWGWIDPENVVLLIPIDALILAAILLYERNRDRVRK
jgi:membrane-bound metal-dependent hydrolase YbcI (DUF457 family)